MSTIAKNPATQPSPRTKLTILGSAAATPGVGQDPASFIVNDTLLIHIPNQHREASLAAARRIFSNTEVAEDGKTLAVAHGR